MLMGLMEPLVWARMHTCQTAMLVHVCTVLVYWGGKFEQGCVDIA